MKKYCYFVTESPHWFDVAIQLEKENIAKPMLWLGDDRHFKNASNHFGKSVVRMQTFVHRPYELKNIDYFGEYQEFFTSNNYLRSKDRCMKMMDRLDLYGTFSRIDREVYFHQIIIWTLKTFSNQKPDFLLMAEAPHSHAQYLIYEICLFLDIPIFKFNRWTLAPLLFLQNMRNDELVRLESNVNGSIHTKIDSMIDSFITDVSSKREKYEISYMKKFRMKRKFPNNLINYFTEDIFHIYRDIRHNIANYLKSRWTSINPYQLNFFTRRRIQKRRAKNLFLQHKNSIQDYDLDERYVYYALHYEHERSTNPDGGDYHDQFRVIQSLRSMLPKSIKILVKEHPSQFLIKDRGSRGRSPLFYELLKNIDGVKIVDSDLNSIKLIQNSEFIVTVTGTVALEASILGKKAITFGSTWFPGCPNIISWHDGLTYDDVKDHEIKELKKIREYLMDLKKNHSVIGCQNGSAMRRFSDLITAEFKNEEKIGVINLIKTMINTI